MSGLGDVVNAPITDDEVNQVLRVIAIKGIRQGRAIDALGKVMTEIEKQDKTCRKIIMCAEDFFILRQHLRERLDIISDYRILKTGKMAVYCGADIIVSHGFENMVGVPEFPVKAEGSLQILEEKII
jgi:hypothetical protein